jgi:hypothetical protein
MNLVKLSDGTIINLTHVVQVEKSDKGGLVYLLGMMQPTQVSEDDFTTITQIADYSEAKLFVQLSELSPMTLDSSMRLFTELMLHFVAHAMAVQQGTVHTFPTQAVYERIANILNQINTDGNQEIMDEDMDEEEEDEK